MAESAIEWTDKVWNPVRGCSIVSAGCKNCYAMKQAHRFSGAGGAYDGLTQLSKKGPVWTGAARFVPEMLGAPLAWRKPQRVFVNSMSDLFHDDITDHQIAEIFAVMLLSPQHTFQVLTKRPQRMKDVLSHPDFYRRVLRYADILRHQRPKLTGVGISNPSLHPAQWIWLGISAENQETADERIPLLLQTPAAVRFVSAEPLLGPLDLDALQIPGEKPGLRFSALQRQHDARFGSSDTTLDWVIVGGESGPGARICEVAWIESIVKQCAAAGVSCFVKQVGAKPALSVEPTGEFRTHNGKRQLAMKVASLPISDRKGGDVADWPAHLRVRQFPEVPHA